jgi:hypothetical protein
VALLISRYTFFFKTVWPFIISVYIDLTKKKSVSVSLQINLSLFGDKVTLINLLTRCSHVSDTTEAVQHDTTEAVYMGKYLEVDPGPVEHDTTETVQYGSD